MASMHCNDEIHEELLIRLTSYSTDEECDSCVMPSGCLKNAALEVSKCAKGINLNGARFRSGFGKLEMHSI